MEKEIMSVLKYFSFFAYYPTGKEIYAFLQAKFNKNSFNIELDRMVKQKKILASKDTPPQYSIRRKISHLRQGFGGQAKIKISENKLNNWRFRAYVKLISLFPQIKLVGLSGSISMMNAEDEDDIDLFIITAKNRLFTGRLITLVLAQLLGVRRNRDSETQFSSSHYQKNNNETMKQLNNVFRDKVCLNLFFDESNLKVPKFKQTLFVGHEVLQMKPIIIKGDIYKRFLEANEWVFRIFPNVKQIFNFQFSIFNQFEKLNLKKLKFSEKFKIQNSNLSEWIECKLKKFQLRLINKHKTSEIITPTQLWFHPDDFEKKIKY